MVQFKDQAALNKHLACRSYVDGFVPSQSDISAFNELKSAPSPDNAHALRWYNHIKSFSNDEKSKFPGAATSSQANGAAAADDDDDDFDVFGSDDEDEATKAEKEKVKEDRLKAYAEKKQKKPGPIAKSSVVFDVKPWDDETDLLKLETEIRTIAMDGLRWGAGKLVPIAFGIKKLQIMCIIEDDKVSTEDLQERIEAYEDFVQSTDIAAFNKI